MIREIERKNIIKCNEKLISGIYNDLIFHSISKTNCYKKFFIKIILNDKTSETQRKREIAEVEEGKRKNEIHD
jgi:hypothetical protein